MTSLMRAWLCCCLWLAGESVADVKLLLLSNLPGIDTLLDLTVHSHLLEEGVVPDGTGTGENRRSEPTADSWL